MADEHLTESLVRQHLRDQAGEARCAACLARELDLQPGGALTRALADLAERQPPFAPGRCSCGADGLMFVLR
jgi:hypothetical protein